MKTSFVYVLSLLTFTLSVPVGEQASADENQVQKAATGNVAQQVPPLVGDRKRGKKEGLLGVSEDENQVREAATGNVAQQASLLTGGKKGDLLDEIP
ncbi:hypothetical protein K502DRAFT_349574 [Neoconidiobolus thromboides FSU 785]|nr:hypothetical protein K502DRAFT_349574 [Neoconidiobolus thromboides FSU 785]